MLTRQPISFVSLILSAAAILYSGIVLVRACALPWWAKLVGALLAIYGVMALVFAITSGTPHLQLFQDAREWTPLQFWLQGATVGTLFAIPLTIVLGLINTLKYHTQKVSRWSLHAAILGACFAIGILAMRMVPQSKAVVAAVAAPTDPEEATPTLQPADFTKNGPPSGRELTGRDYNVKPGSSPVTVSNTTASLTVREFRIVPSLGDQQPTPRHALLVVSTDWKNTGPIPYMVPGVPDHLFLLIQGHSPATVSDATKAAPHPLPTDSLTIPAGNNLSGNG